MRVTKRSNANGGWMSCSALQGDRAETLQWNSPNWKPTYLKPFTAFGDTLVAGRMFVIL